MGLCIMSTSHTDNPAKSHCIDVGDETHCPNCHVCSDKAELVGYAPAGWAFAARAAGTFLFPLAAALVGIGLAGNNQGEQLLGALVGLVAGALTAFVLTRAIAATSKHLARRQLGK